jgi:hypothetical protein
LEHETAVGTPKWSDMIRRKGKALGQVNTPVAVAVTGDGTVCVADAGNDRTVFFPATGTDSVALGNTGN